MSRDVFPWSQLRESNPGPLLYESIALPAELSWQKKPELGSGVLLVFVPSFHLRSCSELGWVVELSSILWTKEDPENRA